MPAYAFDTLKAADALIAAGIDSPHARAITETMRDAVTEGVATKADIAAVNSRLDALESRLDTMQWAMGFHAAVTLSIAGRLFGVL